MLYVNDDIRLLTIAIIPAFSESKTGGFVVIFRKIYQIESN